MPKVFWFLTWSPNGKYHPNLLWCVLDTLQHYLKPLPYSVHEYIKPIQTYSVSMPSPYAHATFSTFWQIKSRTRLLFINSSKRCSNFAILNSKRSAAHGLPWVNGRVGFKSRDNYPTPIPYSPGQLLYVELFESLVPKRYSETVSGWGVG